MHPGHEYCGVSRQVEVGGEGTQPFSSLSRVRSPSGHCAQTKSTPMGQPSWKIPRRSLSVNRHQNLISPPSEEAQIRELLTPRPLSLPPPHHLIVAYRRAQGPADSIYTRWGNCLLAWEVEGHPYLIPILTMILPFRIQFTQIPWLVSWQKNPAPAPHPLTRVLFGMHRLVELQPNLTEHCPPC